MKQLSAILFAVLVSSSLYSQKRGQESINSHDLKMHLQFLASDELQGRETGEPGLQIAARYLAVQAEQLGLEPVHPDSDYLQPYKIVEKSYDREKSMITITGADGTVSVNNDPFYILPAPGGNQKIIEGDVVFAGYGINSEENGYNDFENIDIEDKIVLFMNRAPLNEEGTETQFDNDKWSGMQNFQYKMSYIFSQHPKAVMMVMDPRSGMNSIEDINPAIAGYLSRSRTLKTDEEE